MFGSPEWRALYRHALSEAARLGLEIGLNIQSGWNLGGPTVKPAQAAKLLTWSRVTVDGPAEVRENLAPPLQRNGFYRDIAVLAYPLHHGRTPGRPIRQLAVKSASQEFGMSMPATAPLLDDFPAQPGEEDASPQEVQDVTARMSADGAFAWHVPEGTREILRIGYTDSGARVSTCSPTWQGLAIDYMDRAAFEDYWRENLEPLIADAKPYPGALRYLVTDSWELGGINWTPAFRTEFQQRRGYDPLPYLPIIAGRILGSRDTSDRFLNDFRRTVGDLIISGHYAVFAEMAARAGLGIHPESGGPHGAPIDALETLGVSTFPQTEFWARSATHRTRDDERFFVKEAASAAHTYGKTLVAAEGMTSIGPQWEESVWDNLKPTFDQAATEGLNRLVWHTFTSSPKEAGVPGQEYFAGTHLNPNVTWWNQAGPFLAYINRVSFLLQQGRPVSDVVYYYGDNVPNFAQLKSSDPAKILPGYDYDVADENVLTHRMSARGGHIVLPDGASYRLLVLPPVDSISPAAIRAIRQLVNDGGVVVGSQPLHATGLQGDEEVARIGSELWAGCAAGKPHHFGKGAVYCGDSARAVLAAISTSPDVEYRAAAPAGLLDYIHRESTGADIYFIRNTRPQAAYAEITVRVRNMGPELWHPDTGAIEPVSLYGATPDGRTRLPLWLGPNGSVFVVLRRAPGPHAVSLSKDGSPVFPGTEAPAAEVHLTDIATQAPGRYTIHTDKGQVRSAVVPSPPKPVTVEGPWTVHFTAGWNAPATATFPRLVSWTEIDDPSIRYYSGTATYSATFTLAPGQLDSILDLGDVRELAQVRLNGKDLGVLWKKPFTVPLAGAARSGANGVEVAVTNFWPNRLIGDQNLPPDRRRTRTNITKYKADSPLMPSGLLGPVVIQAVPRAKFTP